MSVPNASWLRAAVLVLGGGLLAAAGCNEEAMPDDPEPSAQGASAALSCAALSVRGCPCAGGGMGTQTCDPSGRSFGPCSGCPAAPAEPAASTEPAASAEPAAAGGAAPVAQDAATSETAQDAGIDADASLVGDAAASALDASITELGLAPAGSAPGISCGVALPVLCALEEEKCCARSLRTDTCIGASESCTCDLGECTVMEVYCDGPEDCPMGQVCCGTLAGGSRYERFECAPSCDYAGTQRIACHQDAPECPGNNVCANSQLLTNLQVCIDPATIEQ